MHFERITKTNLRCNFLKDLPSDNVLGLLYGTAQRDLSKIAVARVARATLKP